MLIKDFRKTASPEQKKVIDEIVSLHQDWSEYFKLYEQE